MKASFDTSAVLRVLIPDIPDQTHAVRTLLRECRAGEQIAVADIAIVEAVHVLQRYYQFERRDIADLISNFMNLRSINCNRVMIAKALKIYVIQPVLSFEDCCLSVYAELNDASPLYTFDKKLARQLSQARIIA